MASSISSSSTPSCASSDAFSAIPLATVRIVPSFGFITALYAVSTAFSKASARIGASISSYFLIPLVKPRRSWDRMTPEFPRAPLKDPEEIALHRGSISGFSREATSFAADVIVSVMLVPVSPSGTGNTFNSLIHSLLASRFLAPPRNILAQSAAFIVLISKILFLLTISQSALRLQRKR